MIYKETCWVVCGVHLYTPSSKGIIEQLVQS